MVVCSRFRRGMTRLAAGGTEQRRTESEGALD